MKTTGSPFLSTQIVLKTNGEKGIMHGVHAAERWGEYKAQNACITGSPFLISLVFASDETFI